MGYTYEQLKQMGATPGPAVSPTITPTSTAVVPSTTTPKKKYTYSELQKLGAVAVPAPTPIATPVEPKSNWVGEMVKGLVSAPATMLARPVQLAQSVGNIIGMDIKGNTEKARVLNEEALRLAQSLKTVPESEKPAIKARINAIGAQVQGIAAGLSENANFKPSSGGIIAPAPETWKDVKKDVGRGIETVALGMGPVAGGAAFGVGGSLEQGNDLFSAQTALQAVVGMAAGKILSKVGGPIFNKAGNIIGAVTPKFLTDLARGGAGAVERWAAEQELLGGIAKPLSEKITAGSNLFEKGVGKLFTGAKNVATDALKSQYPGAKTGVQNYYQARDTAELFAPTKDPKGTYKGARDVYEKANKMGVDLKQTAAENKIYATNMHDGSTWDTETTVDALRKETAGIGHDLLRPALKEAEGSVQRIPITEIQSRMSAGINKIPSSKITDAQRQKLLSNIENEFAPGSAADLAHPNGYSLTDLHDSRLGAAANVKWPSKLVPGNVADALSNTYYKEQQSVLAKLLKETAPKDIGVEAFQKKLQDRFTLADYLEKLQGKKVPRSLFQKTLKKGVQLAGGSIGGATGNIYGMFGGYQLGGIFVEGFMNASNPIKAAVLRELQVTEPAAFNALRAYIGDQEAARLIRVQLPGASKTTAPDLMKMQNANGAVEMNYTPKATTPGEKMGNDFTQNTRLFGNTPMLPAPAERTIVPNTQGTPNITSGTYSSGGDQGQVGGLRQRIFQGAPQTLEVKQRAFDLTKKNGGVTISLNGDVPTKGFAYSPYKDVETIIPENSFAPTHIDDFIEKYYNRLTQAGHHLGVWVDEGKVYMDISKVNPNEHEAVLDSLKNNQIGLFDLSTFETKLLKDYEKIGNTYTHKGKN